MESSLPQLMNKHDVNIKVGGSEEKATISVEVSGLSPNVRQAKLVIEAAKGNIFFSLLLFNIVTTCTSKVTL